MTDLNAIRARLGSLPRKKMTTVPPQSLLHLLGVDLPLLLARVERYEAALKEIRDTYTESEDKRNLSAHVRILAIRALADGGVK